MVVLVIGVSVWFVVEVAKLHLDHTPRWPPEITPLTAQKLHHVRGRYPAMAVLLEPGHSQSAVGRLLGVSEGTVRHHRKRWASGSGDGRSRQVLKAAAHAQAIAHWRDQQEDGRVNLAALHDWLCREHGYDGSLKSVQRYWTRVAVGPDQLRAV